MKSINLTEEQIKTIKTALDFLYSSKLKVLEQNRNIMSEEEVNELLKTSNSLIETANVFD